MHRTPGNRVISGAFLVGMIFTPVLVFGQSFTGHRGVR